MPQSTKISDGILANKLASVSNTTPASDAPGLVVRGAGNFTISGTVIADVGAGGGFVSVVNSSNTPLDGNAVFTGQAEDVSGYSDVVVFVFSDVVSAENGLAMEFSTDGSNWDFIERGTISAGLTDIHTNTVVAKYFRVIYTNGSIAQTAFRLQVIYNVYKNQTPITRLSDILITDEDATLARSVICGVTESGLYIKNAQISNEGFVSVRLSEPVSAFGEVSTVEATPTAQVDFVYGINANTAISTLIGSGTATASNGVLFLSTTAATNSTASVSSKRYLKYRDGQGGLARFTSVFTIGVSGSTQIAGAGDANNGYFFGYNGPLFGILHRSHSSGGVIDTWIPQITWNGDTLLGTGGVSNLSSVLLDPTNGDVFQIKMACLGFGNIKFYIMNSNTSQFILVHQIKYANTNAQPLVSNPSFSLMWQASNTTNNTNIVVKTASGGLFIEGKKVLALGGKYALNNNKSSVTTEIALLTIKNATTFNGFPNKSQINLISISFVGIGGNNFDVLRVILNATLGGTPVYTDIDTVNSITSFDMAGTTITGGVVLYNMLINAGGSNTENVSDIDIILIPGDTITFSGTATGSAANLGVAISWTEDI